MAASTLWHAGLCAQPPRRETARPGRPTTVFRRLTEPREGALSILVPVGWVTEGGITRVNPLAAGGAANAIEAKLDFTLKRDAEGTVLMRWLPSMKYADLRGTPVGNTGMFPPGSNYAGMTVFPLIDASAFLSRVAIPYAHPKARNLQVMERKPMPGLAQQVRRTMAGLPFSQRFQFYAAMLVVSYEENGRQYKERLVTAIHSWGQIAADTNRYIQQLDREIVAHRQRTNAEINKDMFLTLTSQEEYVNPHSGKVETGSNQWNYPWVSPSGEEIYTDDQNYNPTYDRNLQRTDFKRSQVRPR